ncbi:MAG TPA: hypothetical protein VFE65_28625 [Pseudonocardia sp.]|jgi:hypothetical protein|nr:hypothetical protein [Pseudonocardia sp.]
MSCRRADVIEAVAAWLLGIVGILGVPLVALVGNAAYEHGLERAGQESARHSSATPDLTRGLPGRRMIDQGDRPVPPGQVGAPGSTAHPRQGVIELNRTHAVGPTMSGRSNESPRFVLGSGVSVKALVLACGSVALLLACAVSALALAWRLVTRWTTARNHERWASEWAEVEPAWSGRRHQGPRRPEGPGGTVG